MQRNEKRGALTRIWICLAMLVLASASALAAATNTPTGPDTFTTVTSERFTGGVNGTLAIVEAGNVTGVVFAETTVTKAWAGYYGNVTGTITLSDASNNTLYNWQLATPSGEVYASNGSAVNWDKVACLNFTAEYNDSNRSGTMYPLNVTQLEAFFNINSSHPDGINETFNDTYIDSSGFFVGQTLINNLDGCKMTYTYTNGTQQSSAFKEVILTDNSSIIWTALINNSWDNFKNGTEQSDFQMLVAEDGHPGFETGLTNYYFFVELT